MPHDYGSATPATTVASRPPEAARAAPRRRSDHLECDAPSSSSTKAEGTHVAAQLHRLHNLRPDLQALCSPTSRRMKTSREIREAFLRHFEERAAEM